MLLELHIRNFALIEQADLEFREGLNVFSGETGAGKSILIDSIAAALGGKSGREAIRTGADAAYIELVFKISKAEKRERLLQLGVEPESDGVLIVSRKITADRSTFRINDRTVTAGLLRRLAALVIDIHGQHEVQTLFDPEIHLRFLDLTAGDALQEIKASYGSLYRRYQQLRDRLKQGEDDALRAREMELLRYEIQEIEEARLEEGEEERLQTEYTRGHNAERIRQALSEAGESLEEDSVSRALRRVSETLPYAPDLQDLAKQLIELESLTDDALREIRGHLDDTECDEERLAHIAERLDQIRRLQDKYREDVPGILRLLSEKKERLESLEDFETNREALQNEEAALCTALQSKAEQISSLRRESAGSLEERVIRELRGLNFPEAVFSVVFRKGAVLSEQGIDTAEFYISTNRGEPVKPLRAVASGGELSRIMLALKTVLAAQDQIESLIFDEIDTGISGRTAQAVSQRLYRIGAARQVLCITHLPQIAAMADHHYLLEKESDGTRTRTRIREISGEEIVGELGRLIGGSVITEGVLKTAREMKRLADELKEAGH